MWQFGHRLAAAGSVAGYAQRLGAAGHFGKQAKALRHEVHTVLKQVDYDYVRMQYNTVVSGAMKILNALEDFKGAGDEGADIVLAEGFGILLRVLYPITPHLTHALWAGLDYVGAHGELLDAPWPKVDDKALEQDEIELVLQVNGKHRGSVSVPAGASKDEIERLALASEAFAKFGGGATPRKVIVVPGRLVNVVV